jgi:anti-sigma regulatory factor (Ser/Thr protein kinase)
MSDACPIPGPNPHGRYDGYDRYDAVTYTPYPRNVPPARHHVAQLVLRWGHPGVAADAALVTSELCTNALLHGCLRDRLFRLETTLRGATLRIAVTDPRGERLPQARSVRADEQFGRGLLIVEALTDRWAVEPLTVGKSVWAEWEVTAGSVSPCPWPRGRRAGGRPG